MNRKEAAGLLMKIVSAYPSLPFPKATVAEWEEWLLALPYDVGRRGVLTVCASEDFPKIPALIRACGIGSEPVMAMLVAAKDGGFELVRDETAQLGWRTTRDALPAPEQTHGEPIPMPEEVRQRIKAAIHRIAEKRSVT